MSLTEAGVPVIRPLLSAALEFLADAAVSLVHPPPGLDVDFESSTTTGSTVRPNLQHRELSGKHAVSISGVNGSEVSRRRASRVVSSRRPIILCAEKIFI